MPKRLIRILVVIALLGLGFLVGRQTFQPKETITYEYVQCPSTPPAVNFPAIRQDREGEPAAVKTGKPDKHKGHEKHDKDHGKSDKAERHHDGKRGKS